MTRISIQEAQVKLAELIHDLHEGTEVVLTEHTWSESPARHPRGYLVGRSRSPAWRCSARRDHRSANELLLSAATIWEIAIKVGLGKLSLSMPYRQWMNKARTDLGATLLSITVEYADAQAGLPFYHRDPFDRLLIAQAKVDDVPPGQR